MGLPGDVRNLNPSSTETCEYTIKPGTGIDGQPDCWDTACGVKATVRVQGETDSFGAEYAHYCEDHFKKTEEEDKVREDEWREKMGDPTCDYCKKRVAKTEPHRDPDEGRNGPVYWVCRPCIWKSRDAQD